MHLVQFAGFAEFAAIVAAADGGLRHGGGQIGEMRPDQINDAVMFHRTRGGNHDVAGGVMGFHVAGDINALEVADDFLGAENRAAHGLVRVGSFLEMIEDDVVGRVVGLADFL